MVWIKAAIFTLQVSPRSGSDWNLVFCFIFSFYSPNAPGGWGLSHEACSDRFRHGASHRKGSELTIWLRWLLWLPVVGDVSENRHVSKWCSSLLMSFRRGASFVAEFICRNWHWRHWQWGVMFDVRSLTVFFGSFKWAKHLCMTQWMTQVKNSVESLFIMSPVSLYKKFLMIWTWLTGIIPFYSTFALQNYVFSNKEKKLCQMQNPLLPPPPKKKTKLVMISGFRTGWSCFGA